MFIRQTIKATIYVAALFFASNVKGQSDKLGTWDVLNGEYYINNRWNLWFETQLRSQKFFNDFYYHELKGGINYKLNKNAAVFIGTGQYGTYSIGGNFKRPVATHEFRLWEQLVMNSYIGRIKFEHRYRIEQRWINHVYRNRFRYRLNPIIPINKSAIVKNALFASLHYEIFVTDKAPYNERNRMFAGLGYMISNPLTLQIGWIRQNDFSVNSVKVHKDFIQTTLFFRLNQHKATANQPPLTFND